MARNPELDHECREGKTNEKPIQIVYRDHDNMPADPIEMRTITEFGGVSGKGWKNTLMKIGIGVGVIVAGLAITFAAEWLAPHILNLCNLFH